MPTDAATPDRDTPFPVRPPNSHDVARRAGVSRTMVSYVFNGRADGRLVPEETRRRVLRAAEEIGYRPNRTARALRTGRMNAVALWSSLSTPYYAMLLRRLQERIAADGFEMVVTGSRKAGPFDLNHWPVDGIIAVDKRRELDAFLDENPLCPPVVSMGAFYSRRVDYAAVDLYGGAWAALEYLAATGRSRIAFVASRLERGMEDEADGKADGGAAPYRERAGIGMDPRLAAYLDFQRARREVPHRIGMEPRGRAGARDAVRDAAAAGAGRRPDAFLCLDDDTAIGALRGLRDAAVRVPEEAAVIGCDGIEDGEYQEPTLTTIVQPVGDACDAAWRFLATRIETPSCPAQQIVLPARLEVRGST